MEIKCNKCGRETFCCHPVHEEVKCLCGTNKWTILEKEIGGGGE